MTYIIRLTVPILFIMTTTTYAWWGGSGYGSFPSTQSKADKSKIKSKKKVTKRPTTKQSKKYKKVNHKKSVSDNRKTIMIK